MRSKPMTTALLFVAAGAYVVGLTTLQLWLSGDWHWAEGWVFGICWAALIAAIFLWLHYKDTALLAERMRLPGSGGRVARR